MQAPAKPNPYAQANTSNDFLAIPGYDAESVHEAHSRRSSINYGNASIYAPTIATTATTRKHSRRMSIHQSALAHAHGRSFSLVHGGFDAANLPPVPMLPTTSNGLHATQFEEDPFLNIEAKIFQDLAHGTAAQIDDYFNLLVKQKAIIAKDMKANINQNQKNVLQLTNDLKDIQDELLQLRVLTKGLYEVLDDFRESAQRRIDLEKGDQLPTVKNIRKDRSSILVLEKIWANELLSLFRNVEGASKYIQVTPGRHVLAESGRWQEINVATWKPIKPTHLFILNDLLLLATKRVTEAKNNGTKSRLQAIQCWPLNQVELGQIEAPPGRVDDSKTYLINIKSKSLSYVFQTDRYDHFLKITEAYTKGKSELLQQQRLQNATTTSANGSSKEEKRKLRESYRNSVIVENIDEGGKKRLSGSFKKSGNDNVLQDISARVHLRNRSHDFGSKRSSTVDSKTHFFNDLKGLEDQLDDVDVQVAHNDYGLAVGFIGHIEGKLKSIEGATSLHDNSIQYSAGEVKLLIDVIKMKINNRKTKVQQGLIFDLQHNIAKLTDNEIESIIQWFELFNQLEKGITAYLSSMSNHLSATVTRLIVGIQGLTKIDVVNYLSNLVVINISIIKRVVLVYSTRISKIMEKHKDGSVDSSGLINWCVEEITKLVTQMKKHLYGTLIISVGTNPDTKTPILKVKDEKLYAEFLDAIVPQLDELKTVGVNVDFVLEEILLLHPTRGSE